MMPRALRRAAIALTTVLALVGLALSTAGLSKNQFSAQLTTQIGDYWTLLFAASPIEQNSTYAYVQYATNAQSLCNSLTIFQSLSTAGSVHDRVLLVPKEWAKHMSTLDMPSAGELSVKHLFTQAIRLGVRLKFVDVISIHSADSTWQAGFTKFLSFNQTEYDRVVIMDSDGMVLGNLDDVFTEVPSTYDVAMPYAYWLRGEKDLLSAQFIVLKPAAKYLDYLMDIVATKKRTDYDMEIINYAFKNESYVLPHQRYDLLTGEFRTARDGHANFLENITAVWDAQAALDNALYVHFSDYPLPKPWVEVGNIAVADVEPKCPADDPGCAESVIWHGLYRQFREQEQAVCY
ncbi:nucleotide-diphospho-sugar transferase [Dipodascopsis tothii]|uniref:nucleotide-diphospho-sugar transferase n=1 Tax=Dipodascopsis tothii TaxID=44089 RepID=UPI0034CF12BF